MRERIRKIGSSSKALLKNCWRSLKYAYQFSPRAIFLMLILGSLIPALTFAQNKYFGRVIDGLVSSVAARELSALWQLVGIYALLLMISPILRAIRTAVDKHYYLKLQEGMEVLLLKRRSETDIATLEDKNYQDLLQRALQRGHWPIGAIVDNLLVAWQSLIAVVIGSLVAVWFDWRIFAIVIAASLPKFIADIRHGQTVWSIHAHASPDQRRFSDLRSQIANRISLIETKLYQSTDWLLNWMSKILGKFTDDQISAEQRRLKWVVVAEVLSTAGFVLAILLIVREVMAGNIQIGAMTFIVASLSQLDGSISGLLISIAKQYEANQYVNDIYRVMDWPSIISRAKKPKKLELSGPPEIVFENVSFHYPHDPKLILDGLNLTIKAGEKLGIVGINGAGKTTLVKLLCRIYDPTSGRILVNGTDLRQVDLEEWHSVLAVLFQDYTSFDFQTDQAIAMGRVEQEIVPERVRAAAETSDADSFIRHWKKQYEEMLGVEFGGQELSRGQRQRLAIARAAYRQGRVLVLDEPTASVDADSEMKIFERLESWQGVTMILISHRFNTLRRASRITLIEGGKVAEIGSHEELMALGGRYAEMFTRQVESYVEATEETATARY